MLVTVAYRRIEPLGQRDAFGNRVETLNRVIQKAKRLSAPAQINVPRDFWNQVIDIELPPVMEFEGPAGGRQAIRQAAALLFRAQDPEAPTKGAVTEAELAWLTTKYPEALRPRDLSTSAATRRKIPSEVSFPGD